MEANQALKLAQHHEQQGDIHEALQIYEALTKASPKDLEINHKKIQLLFQDGQTDTAIKQLQKLLKKNPNSSNLLCTLGTFYLNLNQFKDAEPLLLNAIKYDKNNWSAVNNLANLYIKLGQYQKAIRRLSQVIEGNPQFQPALINIAHCFKVLGDFNHAHQYLATAIENAPADATLFYHLGNLYKEQSEYKRALTAYKKALQLKPEMADTEFAFAVSELTLGHYKKGWRTFDSRLRTKQSSALNLPKLPQWNLSQKTKNLLIISEQGLGDHIQMFRYIPSLLDKTEQLWIECPAPLLSLAKQSFTDDRIHWLSAEKRKSLSEKKFDYYLPLLSLPRLLDDQLDLSCASAYLTPKKTSQDIPSKGPNTLKIGLVWQGNSNNPTDYKRSISLTDIKRHLARLGEEWPVAFYSLQLGGSEEWKRNQCDVSFDLTTRLKDFSETAQIIHELDLVISVDTAVAHLAGAMNHPVWMLVSKVPDWRWGLNSNKTKIYPSMELFRQNQTNDWSHPLSNIAKRLDTLLEEKNREVL